MLFLECEMDVGLLKVIVFAKTLLNIAFIAIPIGLIVMLSIDLAKNVMAGSEDDQKKNIQIAIKRIIYCVVAFFVPFIVKTAMIVIDDIFEGLDISTKYTSCFSVKASQLKTIAKTQCNNQGGTWDSTTQVCETKDVGTEKACTKQGGKWNSDTKTCMSSTTISSTYKDLAGDPCSRPFSMTLLAGEVSKADIKDANGETVTFGDVVLSLLLPSAEIGKKLIENATKLDKASVICTYYNPIPQVDKSDNDPNETHLYEGFLAYHYNGKISAWGLENGSKLHTAVIKGEELNQEMFQSSSATKKIGKKQCPKYMYMSTTKTNSLCFDDSTSKYCQQTIKDATKYYLQGKCVWRKGGYTPSNRETSSDDSKKDS